MMMGLYSDDNDDDIYLIIMIMFNLPVSLQAGASLGEPGQVVGCTSENKKNIILIVKIDHRKNILIMVIAK